MFLKTVIALFFSIIACAQQNNKPYPYRVESENWINNYRNLKSDEERLSEIKKKIYSDTLYYNYKKRIILDNKVKDSSKHICKALIYLISNEELIDLDLQENPTLKDFINDLNLKKISSIRLLEYPENMTSFGTNGMCCVIYLECSDKFMKKIKRKIK